MVDKTTIGKRAARAINERVHYGKVQPELDRLNIPRGSYSRWKHGNGDPQGYWLQQLALAGYDIFWILTGIKEPVNQIDYDIVDYEEEP